MKTLITTLTEAAARLNSFQLIIVALGLTALVFAVTVLLWNGFRMLRNRIKNGRKTTAFIKERNRFHSEIAQEQGAGDLMDGIKGLIVLVAITVVIIAFSHGK